MKSRNLIDKYDVEKYDILIPFRNLPGRTKKIFLYSELEKRHPCFSDEFCFDVLFRKITSKGFMADVFVISKLKLAEYEGKLKIPGMGFGLESQKRRIFISRKFRMFFRGLVICLFLFGVAICCDVVKSWGKDTGVEIGGKSESVETGISGNYVEDFEDNAGVEGDEGIDGSEVPGPCELLLEVLKKNTTDAAVSKLEWQTDGFIERFSANLKNVFPDELEGRGGLEVDAGAGSDCALGLEVSVGAGSDCALGLEGGPVTYSEGVPHMLVGWTKRVGGKDGAAGGMGLDDASGKLSGAALSREVKEILWADDAVILSESFSPYTIDFRLPGSAIKRTSVFHKLLDLLHNSEYIASAVTVTSENQKDLNIRLIINSALFKGLDISLLDDCLNFFELLPYPEELTESRLITQQLQPSLQQIELPSALRKIGEIHSEDGSVVIFYKSPEGKLIRKKEVL